MRKVADYEMMGKRLQEARRKAKVTQVQLAAACDCDPKHISAVENGKKHPSFDLLLIAVRPDYQDRGVNSLIVDEMTPYFSKYGIQRIESSAILETNNKSQANFVIFDHIQHKRRRAYVREL